MATRKRKQEEELVALPSDESEEEDEYVHIHHSVPDDRIYSPAPQLGSLQLQVSLESFISDGIDDKLSSIATAAFCFSQARDVISSLCSSNANAE